MSESRTIKQARRPKKPAIHHPHVSKKYTIGQRVMGSRSPDQQVGELVRMYYTINTNLFGTFRNYAYVIKCDTDGKERSFQQICALD